jgi:hypothetical protein
MSVGTQEDHPNVAVADSSSRKAVSFSSAHDETLPVVAVRVCNKDRSPARIHA